MTAWLACTSLHMTEALCGYCSSKFRNPSEYQVESIDRGPVLGVTPSSESERPAFSHELAQSVNVPAPSHTLTGHQYLEHSLAYVAVLDS